MNEEKETFDVDEFRNELAGFLVMWTDQDTAPLMKALHQWREVHATWVEQYGRETADALFDVAAHILESMPPEVYGMQALMGVLAYVALRGAEFVFVARCFEKSEQSWWRA